MWNPYLEEFLATEKEGLVGLDNRDLWPLGKRRELTNRYSWAIPDDESIKCLVSLSPIIEIGAGTGYWARLVRDAGGDVIAFDRYIHKNHYHNPCIHHSNVAYGTAKVTARHSKRTLMLCWPPMSPMAEVSLLNYGGTCLVFVGEGDGGCCANDKFFEMLEDGWKEVDHIKIPQWPYINDAVRVYRREMQ